MTARPLTTPKPPAPSRDETPRDASSADGRRSDGSAQRDPSQLDPVQVDPSQLDPSELAPSPPAAAAGSPPADLGAAPAGETVAVVVEREFAHPPEKLWRALTTPHLMAEWLMESAFAPVVGTRFQFRADWGTVDCQVRVVEPERRLAYTWDAYALKSVVTFTLTPTATGTRLRMEQTGFRPNQTPFLEGARQVSEIAILSAEHFNPGGARNHASDDGAAQMLQELKLPFDVIDRSARFEDYRLLILPDAIGLDDATANRLADYVRSGGRAILSDRSGLDAGGSPLASLDLGFAATGEQVGYEPSYLVADVGALPGLTETPFVMYGKARTIAATSGTVLAEISPPYFNRSYKHFSSHQHAPDNPDAARLGPGVVEHGGMAYVAYPIFAMYHAMGQPLYKYLVRDLVERLMPNPVIRTDLTSSGRATLVEQAERRRHILHLLFAAPQVRGQSVPNGEGGTRVMEMIEDVQSIGPVSAKVRLPQAPSRVYDALSGADVPFEDAGGGYYTVTVPSLRIHTALVFEGSN